MKQPERTDWQWERREHTVGLVEQPGCTKDRQEQQRIGLRRRRRPDDWEQQASCSRIEVQLLDSKLRDMRHK
jgi:hypothetical protein